MMERTKANLIFCEKEKAKNEAKRLTHNMAMVDAQNQMSLVFPSQMYENGLLGIRGVELVRQSSYVMYPMIN
jgi:hypothetical protein